MPTLEQHADKDGYFARVHRGEDRVGTWQISPGGVDWLEASGCGVGQEFSHQQLESLISRRLATNDGGPIGGNQRVTGRGAGASVKELQPNGLLTKPRLLLEVMRASGKGRRRADRSRWHLELALPCYAEPEGKSGRDLRRCQLVINPPSTITIAIESLRINPGRVPVHPRTDRYTVGLVGPVPAGWRYDLWMAGTEGLAPKGTLFTYHEGGSRRLSKGEAVLPGKGYYLLTGVGEDLSVLPAVVQRTFPGKRGWKLQHIHIPDAPGEQLSEQICRLGYLLRA